MTNFARCTEAQLFGITLYNDGKKIIISLCDTRGTDFSLVADGVSRFVATEVREKNIVDRINLWHRDNWSEESQKLLDELVAGSSEREAILAIKTIIAHEMDIIRLGSHVLAEIEAVYGASAVILCEQISLKDQD